MHCHVYNLYGVLGHFAKDIEHSFPRLLICLCQFNARPTFIPYLECVNRLLLDTPMPSSPRETSSLSSSAPTRPSFPIGISSTVTLSPVRHCLPPCWILPADVLCDTADATKGTSSICTLQHACTARVIVHSVAGRPPSTCTNINITKLYGVPARGLAPSRASLADSAFTPINAGWHSTKSSCLAFKHRDCYLL